MGKENRYMAKHVEFNSCIHICMGLGIAWVVSLSWAWTLHSLILGCAFLAVGVGGHIYACVAGRKIEVQE